MAHEFRLRVYYEDTDAAGIVYYANYLKFIERARTEALLELGLSQPAFRAAHGLMFAVREVTATYLVPARLEDQLVVKTVVSEIHGARVVMAQEIFREETLLTRCKVTVVVITEAGRPARLPREAATLLARLSPPANPA